MRHEEIMGDYMEPKYVCVQICQPSNNLGLITFVLSRCSSENRSLPVARTKASDLRCFTWAGSPALCFSSCFQEPWKNTEKKQTPLPPGL